MRAAYETIKNAIPAKERIPRDGITVRCVKVRRGRGRGRGREGMESRVYCSSPSPCLTLFFHISFLSFFLSFSLSFFLPVCVTSVCVKVAVRQLTGRLMNEKQAQFMIRLYARQATGGKVRTNSNYCSGGLCVCWCVGCLHHHSYLTPSPPTLALTSLSPLFVTPFLFVLVLPRLAFISDNGQKPE